MLRLGEQATEVAVQQPNVSPMDFTGKPLKGMVYVEQDGLGGAALARWIDQAAAFARSLPPRGS